MDMSYSYKWFKESNKISLLQVWLCFGLVFAFFSFIYFLWFCRFLSTKSAPIKKDSIWLGIVTG